MELCLYVLGGLFIISIFIPSECEKKKDALQLGLFALKDENSILKNENSTVGDLKLENSNQRENLISQRQKIRKYKEDIQYLKLDAVNSNVKIGQYQNLFNEALDNLMKESVLLPSLVRWVD